MGVGEGGCSVKDSEGERKQDITNMKRDRYQKYNNYWFILCLSFFAVATSQVGLSSRYTIN